MIRMMVPEKLRIRMLVSKSQFLFNRLFRAFVGELAAVSSTGWVPCRFRNVVGSWEGSDSWGAWGIIFVFVVSWIINSSFINFRTDSLSFS